MKDPQTSPQRNKGHQPPTLASELRRTLSALDLPGSDEEAQDDEVFPANLTHAFDLLRLLQRALRAR